MDINYIKMHLVIDRFVQGKLTGDEKAEFEERLIWDNSLREQVDLAETLRAWLRRSGEENKHTISEPESSTGRISNIFLAPRYAAAASFVLGALITFTVLDIPDADLGFTVDASTPSLVMPLLSTRSTGTDIQSIPVARGAITMLLVDVPNPDHIYRVSVRPSGSADPVWTQEGLSVGYLEAIAVGIPGDALPPDTYVISIESAGSVAKFKQEISFKTVASD